VVQSPLYRLPEYQEYPPEYQEWYRVVQSPLYRPPEYQEYPPEYQEWYRVVQSPLYRPPEYQEHPPEYQEWYRVVQRYAVPKEVRVAPKADARVMWERRKGRVLPALRLSQSHRKRRRVRREGAANRGLLKGRP
jgi:hypothetical protein